MVAVAGIYENGFVKLEENYTSSKPVKVIVTFLEEANLSKTEELSLSDFSFKKSQKNLENYKGSLSTEVVNERRLEL